MTTAPEAIYGQFGRTLAFAERTLTAVLRAHLAELDTQPETWYALQLIANDGPGLARDKLTGDLAGSRRLTAGSARELLARLAAKGLISGDTYVDLTAKGKELHSELRRHVGAGSARLLSQFDIADVETTIRTLQAITTRAAEEVS